MSTISPEAQARQQEARHDNGRFGEQTHSAPDMELALLDDAAITERIARSEDAQKMRDDARKIINTVRTASAHYTTQGLAHERDDIIGETIVDVVGQQSRGTEHVTDQAFLWWATRAVTSRHHDGGVHHTTLKGRAELNRAIQVVEEDLGRQLTQRERNELAEEVRLSYPAGRRPAVGYQNQQKQFSLDYTYGPDGEMPLSEVIADERKPADYTTSMSAAGQAIDDLENEESSYSRADARKSAWNLIAAKTEAPKVAVNSVKDDRAFRKVVDELGGPVETARQWREGEADDTVEAALFAPFGDLTSKEMDKVSEVLITYPDFGSKLWDGAMKSATDFAARRHIMRAETRSSEPSPTT